MNSCAASAGLLWTRNPASLSRKTSFLRPIPPEDSLRVGCLIGGNRAVVRLTVRSAGESLLENAAEVRKRGPRQSGKGGKVPALVQTLSDSSEGPRGADSNGGPRVEPKAARRGGKEGGTKRIRPAASGDSKSAQKLAPIAPKNAGSRVKTADSATISKGSKSSSGGSKNGQKLTIVEASVPISGAKVCIQCQCAKLPCDFQKIKSSSDRRADTCRACLAVVKARRLGQELGHLSLGVDEAWSRAKVCTMCRETKELRDFSVNKAQADRTDYICRACRSVCARALQLHSPSDAPQECFTCHVIKPASEYNQNKRQSTGLYASCKDCNRKNARERRQRLEALGAYSPRESKVCWRCEVQKPVSQFHRKKDSGDGLTSDCKTCISAEKKRKYPATKRGARLNRKGDEDASKDEDRDVGKREEAAGRQS